MIKIHRWFDFKIPIALFNHQSEGVLRKRRGGCRERSPESSLRFQTPLEFSLKSFERYYLKSFGQVTTID